MGGVVWGWHFFCNSDVAWHCWSFGVVLVCLYICMRGCTWSDACVAVHGGFVYIIRMASILASSIMG